MSLPRESEMAKKKEVEALMQYEAMFLLPGSAAADLEGALKLVRGIVEHHKGEVLVIKKWDERKLTYEVLRQKRGLFVLCYYKGPGASVSAIERDVNLSDHILRVLVTRADYLNAEEMAAVEPQPIQPREERNPWDRPPERRDDRPRDDRPRDDRPPRDDRAPRDDRPPRPSMAAAGKD
jgi:small subunit ribosomal protein S6